MIAWFKVPQSAFGPRLAADMLESGWIFLHLAIEAGHGWCRARWLGEGPPPTLPCWQRVTLLEVALTCPELLPATDTGSVEGLHGHDPLGGGRWTARIRRLRRDAVRTGGAAWASS